MDFDFTDAVNYVSGKANKRKLESQRKEIDSLKKEAAKLREEIERNKDPDGLTGAERANKTELANRQYDRAIARIRSKAKIREQGEYLKQHGSMAPEKVADIKRAIKEIELREKTSLQKPHQEPSDLSPPPMAPNTTDKNIHRIEELKQSVEGNSGKVEIPPSD